MPGLDGTLKQDHQLMCAAVREAGELAMTFFQNDPKAWDKKKNDPVTEADIALDGLLSDRLQRARPDYGWLSEETEDDDGRLSCDKVWVVDPIDGTRAFIKGKPHFAVCAALVEKGIPVAGAVFNPATDEMFEAVLGQGARLNGTPLLVSAQTKIQHCRMLGPKELFDSPHWRNPWPEMEIFKPNSIAYRIALVAAGQWDASVTLNPKSDWDIAAADLILREAGGKLTTHDDKRFVYNEKEPIHRNVVAAGPALHHRLMIKLDEYTQNMTGKSRFSNSDDA